MKRILLVFGLVLSSKVISQFQFNYSDSIPVFKNGNAMKNPWAGGLNYAQVSDIDFDFDGDLDLLVFDRSADQIRLFENKQEGSIHFYKFKPDGYLLFPNDLRYRLMAIDYNQDGKNDLFTYGIGGIKVYKNIGNSNDGLQWQLAKNLLYSDNWGTQLNLYVSSADIPAIVDVDLDGDIDVLTYHISGEYLQYHKNLSQETYGHSDSLLFELKNECWGGFREDVNSNSVFLNDQTIPCQGGNVPNPELKPNDNTKAHAGSTVLALDMDGNGVKDLILGDVAYPSLNLLINGGTSVNSNSLMISANPNFPSNTTPVNMQLFPAAYWVDVDFDGKKDLIVAPNAKNVSENETSLIKFLNTGSNSVPNFVFETKSFLQEDMIEHGTGSIPILVDIDNDGLEDLFVANFFSYKATLSKESKIAYYKNTGTSTNPIFTFIDNDFNNLSQTNLGLRLIPSFGDLNGDGKKDLILGLENGTICYLKNTTTGSNPTFASAVLNYTDNLGQIINVGQYAAPQLIDLNKDGKLDLVIGNKTGELKYYENIGTPLIPNFELKNPLLGGVDVSSSVSPDGYAVPHFFNYLDTTYLMVGALDGTIHFYDSIENNLGAGETFSTISENFLNLSKNLGAYGSVFINDMDTDGNLDMFIGQDIGGIFFLEHDINSSVELEENLVNPNKLLLFPNPTSGVIKIQSHFLPLEMQLLSSDGRELNRFFITSELSEIAIHNLPKGIYFLKEMNSESVYRIMKN